MSPVMAIEEWPRMSECPRRSAGRGELGGPRKTAANAGSRSDAPKLSDGPVSETNSTPAKRLTVPDAAREIQEHRSTLIQDNRAAPGLLPEARM